MRGWPRSGGWFDYPGKRNRLDELTRTLEDPELWQDHARMQALERERAALEREVTGLDDLTRAITEQREWLELSADEQEPALLDELGARIGELDRQTADLEFACLFSGEADRNPAFIDIQAGSGGTEAQDWAEMLLRMYLRFAESRKFEVREVEKTAGETAGIKHATLKITGDYAFGYLRTETGVHRLVRKSPFDSGNRRHTSFASVYVYPEIDDTVEVEINPADLRIDTYRASGAGGQHVNRTDSAVRITHTPTNIVVQCQNDRSQHRNRAEAMNMLRAKLYEAEMQKRRAAQQAEEANKAEIGWGSQIRSYVLDQSRIKDLRTGHETGNPQAVLDGDLQDFIEASLRAGI